MSLMRISLLGLLCCCAGRQSNDVINQYASALESKDYRMAYGLMDNDYKELHSFEEFVSDLKASPDDPKEVADSIRNSKEEEFRSEMLLENGLSFPMVLEDGNWRIVGNPVNYYDQSSPRNALNAFVMASEMKRWDMLMLLSPSNYRDKMTEADIQAHYEGVDKDAINNMLLELKHHLKKDIEDFGEKAELRYGDGRVCKFIKEGSSWKILDPDG